MRYYVLASGSKGNATIIESNDHVILIDMGLSLKCLKERLEATPHTINDIEAILVTHNHSDHISGIELLKNISRYAAEGTLKENYNIVEPFSTYTIAGFKITILPTSHDATNPIGFVIESGNEKLVYMTDTGYISERNMVYMKNADYYIIESNHNVRMLLATNRPYELKQRILGDEGHLSNEDSALYISECIGERTKEIVLAHLSEEANTPTAALEAYYRIFRNRYRNPDNYILKTASQHSVVIGGNKVEL